MRNIKLVLVPLVAITEYQLFVYNYADAFNSKRKKLKEIETRKSIAKKNVIWSLLSNPPPTCREPLAGNASTIHSARDWYPLRDMIDIVAVA